MTPTASPRRDLALVIIGGALGTLVRAILLDTWTGPRALLLVNLTGAFLLGALTETLTRRRPARSRDLQLLAGTGTLGGFTTYSALALTLHTMSAHHQLIHAIGYGTLALLGGAAACLAGIALATTVTPERTP